MEVAKKKALDLYNRFSNTANSHIEGKKCALLCVDEILKAYNREYEFWEKVKKEIELL